MPSNKIFEDKQGRELMVISNKKNITFNFPDGCLPTETACYVFSFSRDTFGELYRYLNNESREIWPNVEIREANSIGSDYYEYYDRKFGNNGYIGFVNAIKWGISGEAPFGSDGRMYKFTRRKMEAFLFDMNKKLEEDGE